MKLEPAQNTATTPVAVKANGAVSQPQAGQPSYAELLERIKQLETAQASGRSLSMKVSAKGAIQINGFGRWPFTPYREQAEKLGREIYGLTEEQLAQSPIGRFIAANSDKLSRKADKESKQAS